MSKRTGLSPHVIRVWEKRYQAVEPTRTNTNRRLYSDAEIERLSLLRDITNSGHSIGNVAGLPTERLRQLAHETLAQKPTARGTTPTVSASISPGAVLVEECIEAVKALNPKALQDVLVRGSVLLRMQGLLQTVIAPLAQALGELWREGTITAAHEHFATAVLRTQLGQMTKGFAEPDNAPTVIICTPAGQLHELGAQIILGNTYHLYLRPGEEVLSSLGGLHHFMNWNKPILTDSGGFQVFSLKDLMKLTEEGARFSSHLDGSRHLFTPERVIEIQRCIGSDIIMQFDECTPYPSSQNYARESMERSLRWAERCKTAWKTSSGRYGHQQFLFGIGQGSVFLDLRLRSIQELAAMDLPGYAIGGTCVGEPKEDTWAAIETVVAGLPKDRPHYMMGTGTPEDLVNGVIRGIDMFDCVMPTR
ncbi:MAG: tRNA guanosine(34) transglycosylase Tgt, partial [Planctomycetaceae bacterium]|nr:tRNA guanosine(34) transglycosylase Tgt [Planctomycetaceae bacterium]